MFNFNKYEFDKNSKKARFHYKLNEHMFTEVLDFSGVDFKYKINDELLNNLLFFLHLLLGVSYYKLTCEKGIKIESGSLTKQQADFFNNLYTKGLGEFFFENDLDFKDLISFPYSDISTFEFEASDFREDLSLIPVGGGKDSSVVMSLLEKENVDFDVFTLGENQIYNDVSGAFGCSPIKVKRQIDPYLIELNKTGKFYNGHIPISSIIAGVSLFVSAVSGYRYIILANESSANEGNTIWKGMEINHQYSKSLEFEKEIQDFILENITDITYFSLLRPFSEVKIAKLFAENCKKVFDKFSSCNRNFVLFDKGHHPKWCCECPKCAFVFSVLSPFLGINKTSEIFGENLLNKKELAQTFIDLIGEGEHKPFECVGTYDEVKACLSETIKKEKSNNCILYEIQRYDLKSVLESHLSEFGDHIIPNKFLNLIKKY